MDKIRLNVILAQLLRKKRPWSLPERTTPAEAGVVLILLRLLTGD